MKILISAYACEPDKGSEPFLGWRWSNEIAKHHEVWVITRLNNRAAIEEYLDAKPNKNYHFVYTDLSWGLKKIKNGQKGIQLYYYLWQRQALKVARKLHKEVKFDLVHHLTFGAYTQPTFMYKLDIPFVWGPLGGGEKLPKIKNRKIEFRSWIYEILRNIQQRIYLFLSFTRGAMKKASKILVTTQETYNAIPRKYRDKTMIFQSLGIDEDFMKFNINYEKSEDKVRILMVGRYIGWKGFDIGIEAFKKVLLKYPNAELHLRGNGHLRKQLEEQCGELINRNIFFINKFLNYDEMYSLYMNFDIFLNCTLHDSGCLALLEAMSAKLPIVCINVGGPKVIATDKNAFKIEPKEYDALTTEIANRLLELCCDEEKRKQLGEKSYSIVVDKFLYEKKFQVLNSVYKGII